MTDANLTMNVDVNITAASSTTRITGTTNNSNYVIGIRNYLAGHDGYYYRDYGGTVRTDLAWVREPNILTGIGVVTLEPNNDHNRKEKTEMICRQTFLDALADEGKTITVEERGLVRDAKPDKWQLLIARLLARVFETGDLEMLKEAPKEVLVTTKEA